MGMAYRSLEPRAFAWALGGYVNVGVMAHAGGVKTAVAKGRHREQSDEADTSQ